jgi:hypothetical protein
MFNEAQPNLSDSNQPEARSLSDEAYDAHGTGMSFVKAALH